MPLVAVWAGSAEYGVFGPIGVAALTWPTAGPNRRGWGLLTGAALVAAFARPDPLGALALPGTG